MKPNTAASSGVASASSETSARPGDRRTHVAVRAALGLLRAYKLLISPCFRGSCRFLPSCADYSAEAFARHGFWRGLALTSRRLARCHPLCEAGYDPVPAARRNAVVKAH